MLGVQSGPPAYKTCAQPFDFSLQPPFCTFLEGSLLIRLKKKKGRHDRNNFLHSKKRKQYFRMAQVFVFGGNFLSEFLVEGIQKAECSSPIGHGEPSCAGRK